MSKFGDKQYFSLLLKKEGYSDKQSSEIIDIFIKGMQDKLLEDGSLSIPLFGNFKAEVLPERFNIRLKKNFGESLKVTFSASRKGLLKRWKDTYSSEAKTRQQLEALKNQLR